VLSRSVTGNLLLLAWCVFGLGVMAGLLSGAAGRSASAWAGAVLVLGLLVTYALDRWVAGEHVLPRRRPRR
jgi:hypothetical protein